MAGDPVVWDYAHVPAVCRGTHIDIPVNFYPNYIPYIDWMIYFPAPLYPYYKFGYIYTLSIPQTIDIWHRIPYPCKAKIQLGANWRNNRAFQYLDWIEFLVPPVDFWYQAWCVDRNEEEHYGLKKDIHID